MQDISKDKFVLPTDENEYKQCTLDFYITESVNHDFLDYLDEIGNTDQRQSIREFVSSLAHIEIPLREINMEKDREMWQAYIDGQAAVNADNCIRLFLWAILKRFLTMVENILLLI